MNREKAEEIFKVFGRPVLQIGNKSLVFTRQTPKDISDIEGMSTEELIAEWKSKVWLNNIYGQISLNDMQRIRLIELEMEERQAKGTMSQEQNKEMDKWYEQAEKEMEEQEELYK